MAACRAPWSFTRSAVPRARGLLAVIAFVFASASSCPAATRIESTRIGIPGSGASLGSSVALRGDTAAVGAPSAQPTPLVGSGSVNVYRRIGADWQQEAVLVPGNPVAGMAFGSNVLLGDDLLVTQAQGLVYTFERTGAAAWQQVDVFSGSGGFSLSSGRLALGDGNIFVREGTGWSQTWQLAAEAGEVFHTTTLDGDFALAWTSAYVSNFEIHNYAYLFRYDGSGWVREARMDLGDSGVFDVPASDFALSSQTALISWGGVVTPYVRDTGGNWTAQAPLDPLTSAPGFGARIALDGDRALVSSPVDTVYGWQGAGTTYVFQRTGNVWMRVGHVAHQTVNYYNYAFGSAVALEGDTMLVGAPGAFTDAGATGDATVLGRSGVDWLPVGILDAGNDHRGEEFGSAVAASGDTLLVGAAAAATDDPLVTGAAYVFESSNGSWSEHRRLRPDVPYGAGFGSAVALDQDTAAVGVSRVFGAPEDVAGAVYVFVRDDGSWPQQARLVGGETDRVAFGASVAVQGERLVAGEPGISNPPIKGRVRVFERSGGVWSPQAVIQASDGTLDNGFGSSVLLSGDVLLIGAPNADVGIETGGGAVYVFTNSGGTWSQQAKVTAPIPAKLAGFGRSIALSGNTLVVGAVGGRGAAYVFALVGGVATLQATLVPSNPDAMSSSYGRAVAISGAGDRIVVSQDYGDFNDPNGRAFVFLLAGPGWSPGVELTGATASLPQASGDGFGRSLAMSGETILVGAPADGSAGAVYAADVGDVIFRNGFDAG